MTKLKKQTKRRKGQSASKAMLGSVDRTCKNCKWFRPGIERKIKGVFFTRIEKDEATCAYLNGLICSEARVFNVPVAWGTENGLTYIASQKQVEGPCKAEGLYWEPNPPDDRSGGRTETKTMKNQLIEARKYLTENKE